VASRKICKWIYIINYLRRFLRSSDKLFEQNVAYKYIGRYKYISDLAISCGLGVKAERLRFRTPHCRGYFSSTVCL
jgi:hypothetical protein